MWICAGRLLVGGILMGAYCLCGDLVGIVCVYVLVLIGCYVVVWVY